jgi:hypothetical protein
MNAQTGDALGIRAHIASMGQRIHVVLIYLMMGLATLYLIYQVLH